MFLEKDAITLGAADSNDIILSGDDMIPPHHALLERQQEDYHLIEKDSSVKILLNRQKIGSNLGYKLIDGDQIVIGQYSMTFSRRPTQGLMKPVVTKSLSE